MNADTVLQAERRRRSKVFFMLGILGVLIVAAFLLSMNAGSFRMSPGTVLNTLFGNGTDKEKLVLFEFRLPRISIALLVGAGLALSGCVLQGISRNGLADPGILGINAGSGLVVLMFVAFYPSTDAAPVFALPVLALLGACLTALVIFGMAYKRGEGILPSRLILTGIAIAAAISSATIVLMLRISPEKYQFVATWMAGSIWGSTWTFVLALLPWLIAFGAYIMLKARTLDVFGLGEQTASGLGAPVSKDRTRLLLVAAGLAGACVAVSGGIGFVGLIGPHIARRLVGPRHSALLPTSALCGALLLLIADTISRAMPTASEIPTGIVVAVIGAPYFLYLMARSRA
ncbi:iron ABC transporter permease [Paenibacillus pasadenensis]|uniref:FecCD family ABC transporter permease n=1 Tax=Paenibacillus pasadenensis TaxID=217090 RepID=UPI00203C1920|nr:iron ABC transporter permease [Paenibacillus pasadenensis]MCM3746748.1 iron ABC transporter permease [Paenibacillus pasadenensis]